jgi:hypothetical protein
MSLYNKATTSLVVGAKAGAILMKDSVHSFTNRLINIVAEFLSIVALTGILILYVLPIMAEDARKNLIREVIGLDPDQVITAPVVRDAKSKTNFAALSGARKAPAKKAPARSR